MVDGNGRTSWYEDDARHNRGGAEARQNLHILPYPYGQVLPGTRSESCLTNERDAEGLRGAVSPAQQPPTG